MFGLAGDYLGNAKSGLSNGSKVVALAHARREAFDLHASSKSQVAERALQQIGMAREIEREVKDLAPDEQQRIQQARSKTLLDALHQ